MTPYEQPWLSVLVPVYNVEPFLRQCIESVTAQSDSGIEIIAVDDCSVDHSRQILEELAERSTVPISIIYHDQNKGVSSTRNTLIAAARGQYYWFLDADDLMEPGAIDGLKGIVVAHQPDLIMCDFRVIRDEHVQMDALQAAGERHKYTFEGPTHVMLDDKERLFYGLYKKSEFYLWSRISHRKLWQNGLKFPEGVGMMEDVVVIPRMAIHAKTYFYSPSVWIAYRKRSGSILSSHSLKKLDEMASANSHVLELWLAQYPDLDEDSRLEFSHFCARTHYAIMQDLKRLSPEVVSERKEVYRKKFISNIHWSKSQLCWQYFKRGLTSRIIRLLRHY